MSQNRKNLSIMFFTLVVMMLGFGIIIPIMPFYITKLGATGHTLGLLMATFSIMQFISRRWGGACPRDGGARRTPGPAPWCPGGGDGGSGARPRGGGHSLAHAGRHPFVGRAAHGDGLRQRQHLAPGAARHDGADGRGDERGDGAGTGHRRLARRQLVVHPILRRRRAVDDRAAARAPDPAGIAARRAPLSNQRRAAAHRSGRCGSRSRPRWAFCSSWRSC